jgi:hypothetical protein
MTRPTYSTATDAGLYLSTPSMPVRVEAAPPKSIAPLIVALVGFILAFGGTLVWRAHVNAQPSSALSTMSALSFDGPPPEAAPLPSTVPATSSEVAPSAFEPPPATIALTASVGERPVPPPAAKSAKAEKKRRTRQADAATSVASTELIPVRSVGKKAHRAAAD